MSITPADDEHTGREKLAFTTKLPNVPGKSLTAGESFFEPPESEQVMSENASATEPASLLAVFVSDDGRSWQMRPDHGSS